MQGTVTEFDDAAGLGTVTADDGTRYRFHCTAISDGTRTIAVDTAVDFETRPARDGSYEAAAVSPRAVLTPPRP
jgi:cold shock CspA family protein